MPLGIPVPPKSIVEHNLPAWLEQCVFMTPLDDITSTFSTGEYVLENAVPNVIYVGIGYRLITPFTAASDDVFPEIWFGDSGEHKRFGVLNAQHLTDTEFFGSGFLPIFYEDTSTDPANITAYVHWAGGEAPTAGTVELWLQYRANSESARRINVRAR